MRHTGRILPGPVSIPGAMAAVASSGSGAAWCAIDTLPAFGATGWLNGESPGFFVEAMLPITDQSGEFSQLDLRTIAVPFGTFVVEWTFQTAFRLVNHPPPYVGPGWCLWTGGPCHTLTSAVDYERTFSEFVLQATTVEEGQFPPETSTFEQFTWRGHSMATRHYVIKSEPGKNLLRLGMSSFQGIYKGVVDEADAYFLNFVLPGSADHHVRIVGALDSTPV